MNILVTGGAGYICSHTCAKLLNYPHAAIPGSYFGNSKAETID